MAHFNYTRPGGTWATLYVPTGPDYSDLDTKTFKAINGDEGGSWAPSAPIIIGGSGMQIPDGATWTVFGELIVDATSTTGEVLVRNGGGIVLNTGGSLDVSTGGVISIATAGHLNSSGQCHWEAGGTHTYDATVTVDFDGTLVMQSVGSISATGAGAGWLLTNGEGIQINDGANPKFTTARTRSIVQPLAGAQNFSLLADYFVEGASGQTGYIPCTKLANEACIVSVTAFVQWSTAHTAASLGQVQLYKVDVTSGARTLLASANVNSVSGTQIAVTATVSGTEIVDDSRYQYTVYFVSESGGSAQTLVFYAPVLNFSTITHLQSI